MGQWNKMTMSKYALMPIFKYRIVISSSGYFSTPVDSKMISYSACCIMAIM